jgi:Crp-like helix-turn-helix domain
MQAISQLNRVEDRLITLFWHLAERWGRVAANGVALPLALPHRVLGELVGARRPTVSTALAELSRRGEVMRRHDGTWLLTGDAPAPIGNPVEVVRQRRRLMPGEAAPPPPEPAPRLAVPRDAAVRRVKDLEVLRLETSALRARTLQMRRERGARIDGLRGPGRRPS